MSDINTMLLCDFYKTVPSHPEQYPEGMTKLVSYYTPRMSRLEDQQGVFMFFLQVFIKKYLIDHFKENFFSRPEKEVLEEYARVVDNGFSMDGSYAYWRIRDLHRLGFLPLEIRAVEEGTFVPVKVPMIEISNTYDDFAWLVNSIETLMSCTLWYPMAVANVGARYLKIASKWYNKTVEESGPSVHRALSDFSMRGQTSLESALASSSAWLLFFDGSATVPVIPFIEKYYGDKNENGSVCRGMLSTEHSAMCSNYAVDKGQETSFFKRLLKENHSRPLSVVCDSYDYKGFVTNGLKDLREEILQRDAVLGIRGDSGDPVEIVAWTVAELWKIFGGTTNSKGYKVLHSSVRAIYGDSITPQRANEIYRILEKKGFSAENVFLGAGSFSMLCLQENSDDKYWHKMGFSRLVSNLLGVLTKDSYQPLQPYTRDTYGVAVKSTFCVVNGKNYMIYKNPKTDKDNFKKSQRGICHVYRNHKGEVAFSDGYTLRQDGIFPDGESLLQQVFRNGILIRSQSFQNIREEVRNFTKRGVNENHA